MNEIHTKTSDAAYAVLQDELERRYGCAAAQEIIDQIKKTERTGDMPDYLNFHAASEALEHIRESCRDGLLALRTARQAVKSSATTCLDQHKAQQHFEQQLALYCTAQKGYYRMYRAAMSAHAKRIPAWTKYPNTQHASSTASAA